MSKTYRILITGSSGMLGVDLWQELEQNYDVFGVDLTPNSQPPTPNFYSVDITEMDSVISTVGKIKPDVVIHVAAYTDVDGCERDAQKAYRVNSDGAKNIALACRDNDAVLVYISTDFVFDGKSKTPYKETDETGPLSVYGDSKLKGEEAVQDILKKYYILRTSWLYGKYGKNFVDTILAKAKAEKALKVVDDQVGSPTYTKDLARAIHALLDMGKGYGTYHVSNSGSVSWYDYAREILRLAGSKTKVIPISSEELARPAKRPAMSILDNSKFIEFTGYGMRNWKDALKEYLS